jgi:hypothetical protein
VSDAIVEELNSQPVTDVMLFSHGWMGDVPAAKEQYQGWLATMAACEQERVRIHRARLGFRPLLIGLHWPSLPWGDERLGHAVSFGGPSDSSESDVDLDALVDEYAKRLGNEDAVRDPLRLVLEAARDRGEPDELPEDVANAYRSLDEAIGLPKEGVGGAPGHDREAFDPEAIYRAFRSDAAGEAVSFGLFSRDTLLSPLRTLSFWKMKDRARSFGEEAVHPFLRRLQLATSGRDVRFHLVGHSFGCIVASAAVAGPIGGQPLPKAVDSLALLQGALSLWAYCSRIPNAPGTPSGYFHSIASLGLVSGPIVTSQSRYDTAVGKWYPRAAWTADQVVFAPGTFPKYGAVGTFGMQGPGISVNDELMHGQNDPYRFRPGQIYNIDGSRYINQGGGFSGAHSDIRKPEVAQMVWNAVTP